MCAAWRTSAPRVRPAWRTWRGGPPGGVLGWTHGDEAPGRGPGPATAPRTGQRGRPDAHSGRGGELGGDRPRCPWSGPPPARARGRRRRWSWGDWAARARRGAPRARARGGPGGARPEHGPGPAAGPGPRPAGPAYTAAWNAHDLAAVLARFAPDAVVRERRGEVPPAVWDAHDPRVVRAYLEDSGDGLNYNPSALVWVTGHQEIAAWAAAAFAHRHRFAAGAVPRRRGHGELAVPGVRRPLPAGAGRQPGRGRGGGGGAWRADRGAQLRPVAGVRAAAAGRGRRGLRPGDGDRPRRVARERAEARSMGPAAPLPANRSP